MFNDYELDVNQVSKELKLQLEIIRMENTEELKAIDKERFVHIDWDHFLKLAIHHRIYSLIYVRLQELDETLIPAYVFEVLHRKFKKNTLQMLHLSAEMEQVSKSFTENEVRTLFLKGPVLAVDLYGDISLRTSSDLDILISIDDLDRVEKLLFKQGYVKDDEILTVLNDWKWRHHHKTYYHSSKKITLEIHWRLSPGPSKEPQFEELWGRKRKSSLTHFPTYYLGREDLFLFLVSHGARHGWSRLRWLVDIHQLVRQKLDWGKLNRLLNKYQYLHLGGQALILASQLLKTPMDEEMKPIIVGNRPGRLAQEAIFYMERMVNLHSNPVPEDVYKYHRRHLFSLMSNLQKFFFVMSFLYPYPEDSEALPLPKHFHFLYFPLRPVLWAWRKTKKHVLS
ncbi:Uncharacterised nucleotidyltransferase [Paenibacillus sp. 1_12]|uniref:nucleotidyltransferase domain-containing protein n=1 Tax=Paenibacillus sp. 1_12 TaxID=1566278 RepID=UPI0008E4348D|nr:nucleotidyltransferase family protein [Paenibacillus sp. 1_12]SFL10858.1 Uncharacterised nucleotidyltransferase [Paenibacillus sp. 1_12]